MNHHLTFEQVSHSLEQNRQAFALLPLQNGISIIITQRGGRVLGPFLSAGSESIFWLNPALANPAALAAFIEAGDWNLGGERVWIAPEIQYTVRNRHDFWGSYHLPAQIDPGRYSLAESRPGQWQLSQTMTLDAFNLAAGQKELHLTKRINRVDNPLRALRDFDQLMNAVIFAGYEQTLTLTESATDDILSETWNLVQLNPGGQLIIPAAPCAAYTDYYEPIDDQHQTLGPNHIRLNITGNRRYKVGYKAPHVFGRLGYFNQTGHQAYLIVRNFFNNPSAPYIEEPPHLAGERGHSIHVYNDGGVFGGFGELEVQGQAIGGPTGRSTSTDQLVLWLFAGPVDQIKQLVPHLLGVTF